MQPDTRFNCMLHILFYYFIFGFAVRCSPLSHACCDNYVSSDDSISNFIRLFIINTAPLYNKLQMRNSGL